MISTSVLASLMVVGFPYAGHGIYEESQAESARDGLKSDLDQWAAEAISYYHRPPPAAYRPVQ